MTQAAGLLGQCLFWRTDIADPTRLIIILIAKMPHQPDHATSSGLIGKLQNLPQFPQLVLTLPQISRTPIVLTATEITFDITPSTAMYQQLFHGNLKLFRVQSQTIEQRCFGLELPIKRRENCC